jgi:D-lactate dehydrogenase
MKAVVYSTHSFEKELLAKANKKKHDITLISNSLNLDTVSFAKGKNAVIVFTNDDVSAPVIEKLKSYGIKYIATRSVGTDHIDKNAAASAGIKVGNVPKYSSESIAEHTIALIMALDRKIFLSETRTKKFDFRLDGLQGFCLYQKTVGLIGLGSIGLALTNILKGFGCHVQAYDPFVVKAPKGISMVSLNRILKTSDIISLHAPLIDETKNIINKQSLAQMKKGAMLINTSRGGLIDTKAVIESLENGHLGYYGADVYEAEHDLFFADHSKDLNKDPLLSQLMAQPNVIITPHQAFLTTEALEQIAAQTIKNLDKWSESKCLGTACACTKPR